MRRTSVVALAFAATVAATAAAVPASADVPARQAECTAAGGTYVTAEDNPFANLSPNRQRYDLCAMRTWSVDGFAEPYGTTRETHVWRPVGDPVVTRERLAVGEPVVERDVVPVGEATSTTSVVPGTATTTATTRPVGSPVVVEEVDTTTKPPRRERTSTQQVEVVSVTTQPRDEVSVTTQPQKTVVTSTQAYENVATVTRAGETLNTYTTKTTVTTFTYTHHYRWSDKGRLVPMSIYFVTTSTAPGPDRVVQYPLPAEPKVSVTRRALAPVVRTTEEAADPAVTETRRALAPVVTQTVAPGEPVVTVTYHPLSRSGVGRV